MHGRSVSTVTAYTAHREWARRPPDDRYASVHALAEAARARRNRTDARITETVDLHVQAVTADALAISDRSGPSRALTHWRYARVHHDELADRVLDLMAQHPAWHLPLGYKDGVIGAERVPSGAYLGDRDMFLFLVDGNRNLDDPTDRSHAGMFRGFILRNSDVGAAALTLDLFLFRAVCANHLIWGLTRVAGFRRRHVGASIHEAWTDSLRSIRDALDANLDDDRATLLRVTTQELGPTREDVLEAVN